jgi:hypothetical protein
MYGAFTQSVELSSSGDAAARHRNGNVPPAVSNSGAHHDQPLPFVSDERHATGTVSPMPSRGPAVPAPEPSASARFIDVEPWRDRAGSLRRRRAAPNPPEPRAPSPRKRM